MEDTFCFIAPAHAAGHILSLSQEKGCKECAKGEASPSPLEPPPRSAAAGLLRGSGEHHGSVGGYDPPKIRVCQSICCSYLLLFLFSKGAVLSFVFLDSLNYEIFNLII